MTELTQVEVVGFLRDMAYDYKEKAPEYQALTEAADALESVTVITVDNGQPHITKIHPMLDAKIVLA